MSGRLYLDACAIHRPLDRLVTVREHAEAECVVLLLEQVAQRKAVLIWSSALTLEAIDRAPLHRRSWAAYVRALASSELLLSPSIADRARDLQPVIRLRGLDLEHVAFAEAARATLVTVDRPLLRRTRRSASRLMTAVIDPIDAAKGYPS